MIKALFTYCLIVCFISCNNFKTDINATLTSDYKNEYRLKFVFKGPLEVEFDTSVFNFIDHPNKLDSVKSIKDSINYTRPVLFIENEKGHFRPFSKMPINVSYDYQIHNDDIDTIYKINLKKGKLKMIELPKDLSFNHFIISKNEISKKVKFYYLPENSNEILSSNWVIIPNSARMSK